MILYTFMLQHLIILNHFKTDTEGQAHHSFIARPGFTVNGFQSTVFKQVFNPQLQCFPAKTLAL